MANCSIRLPARRRFWRLLLRTVIGLPAFYLVVVGLLLLLEDRFVFRPATPAERWRETTTDSAFRDETLHTVSGERIHARWFPCPGARGVAFFCHSQNANLSICWPAGMVPQWQRETGLSVLLFDYPGYGHSSGIPSEQGCYAAADAAYDWLIKDQRFAPASVLVVGRSLGTAVAVDLASRRQHRALILVSPFTSIPEVAQARFPLLPTRWLMHNRFDSLSKIGACSRPLLIFHGTDDWKTPIALSQRLFESAHEPRRFITVPGAGHGDDVLADFFPTLRHFLDEFAPLPTTSPHN